MYIIFYAFKVKENEYYFKEYIILIFFFQGSYLESFVDGRRSFEFSCQIEDNGSSIMTN